MANDEKKQRNVVRYIKPLGPRVLVRMLKLEERSASGLYLPEGVKEEHDDALYGEVVEVARADTSVDGPSLGENVSGVPPRGLCFIPKKRRITRTMG